MRKLLLLAIFLICTKTSFATVYYVSTTGDDLTGVGTQAAPWRTIQKCADTVVAGDTCHVAAGRYYELVRIKTSGTSSNRITFEGVRGSNGEFLTAVDGGIVTYTSGWTTAPEIGSGVYKRTAPTWVGPATGSTITPSVLTANGQDIWKLYEPWCVQGTGTGYLDGWKIFSGDGNTMKIYLSRSASTTCGTHCGANTVYCWDGIEALWAVSGGQIYLRFKNGDNPNTKTIRVGPGSYKNALNAPDFAPFFILNNSYNTIKNFLVEHSETAVIVSGASNYNTIENNDLRGVDSTMYVYVTDATPNSGPQNTLIQNNKISSLNFIGYSTYAPIMMGDSTYQRRISCNQYHVNKYNVGDSDEKAMAVWIRNGRNTSVINNEILYSSMALMSNGPAVISGNTFHNFQGGTALYFTGYQLQSNTVIHVNDNLFYECGAQPFRSNDIGQTNAANLWLYYYRNKVYNPSESIGQLAWWSFTGGYPEPPGDLSSAAHVYYYHNTSIGGLAAFGVNAPRGTEGLPNWVIVNNIVQLHVNNYASAWQYMPSYSCGPSGRMFNPGAFDYNWFFAPNISCGWLGSNTWYGSSQMIDDSTFPPNWTPSGAALGAGVDISQPFTVQGRNFSALPGFSPGYFGTASKPDLGAVQTQAGGGSPYVADWDSQDDINNYTTGTDLSNLNGGLHWQAAWGKISGVMTVETAPAGMTTKAIKSAGTSVARYERWAEDASAGTIPILVRVSAVPNAAVDIVVYKPPTTANMVVRFDTDGNIKFEDSTATFNTIQAYSANNTYQVEIQFDSVAQQNKYRVRINQGTWTSWTTVVTGSFTIHDGIGLIDNSTNSVDVWFDDIGIPLGDPPPPTQNTITLVGPIGGTNMTYKRGQTIPIQWTTNITSGKFLLEYSLNDGVFWYSIGEFAYNIGIASPYLWTPALPATNNMRIRISQGAISVTSNKFAYKSRYSMSH